MLLMEALKNIKQGLWHEVSLERKAQIMMKHLLLLPDIPPSEQLSPTVVFGWKFHQMDVKTTLLNGKVEEEVYIEKPEGFVTHGMK